MTNLLSDQSKELIKAEVARSLTSHIASAPREVLVAEVAQLVKESKALFDERYSTTDAVRHAQIVKEQDKNDRKTKFYRDALRENVRNTYGVSHSDLIALLL